MIARLLVAVLVGLAVVGAARLRARRAARAQLRPLPAPVDIKRWLPDGGWAVLSTPWCASCGPAVDLLESLPAAAVSRIDVTEEPELATALDAQRAPTALRFGPDGSVSERLEGFAAIRARVDELRGASLAPTVL